MSLRRKALKTSTDKLGSLKNSTERLGSTENLFGSHPDGTLKNSSGGRGSPARRFDIISYFQHSKLSRSNSGKEYTQLSRQINKISSKTKELLSEIRFLNKSSLDTNFFNKKEIADLYTIVTNQDADIDVVLGKMKRLNNLDKKFYVEDLAKKFDESLKAFKAIFQVPLEKLNQNFINIAKQFSLLPEQKNWHKAKEMQQGADYKEIREALDAEFFSAIVNAAKEDNELLTAKCNYVNICLGEIDSMLKTIKREFCVDIYTGQDNTLSPAQKKIDFISNMDNDLKKLTSTYDCLDKLPSLIKMFQIANSNEESEEEYSFSSSFDCNTDINWLDTKPEEKAVRAASLKANVASEEGVQNETQVTTNHAPVVQEKSEEEESEEEDSWDYNTDINWLDTKPEEKAAPIQEKRKEDILDPFHDKSDENEPEVSLIIAKKTKHTTKVNNSRFFNQPRIPLNSCDNNEKKITSEIKSNI